MVSQANAEKVKHEKFGRLDEEEDCDKVTNALCQQDVTGDKEGSGEGVDDHLEGDQDGVEGGEAGVAGADIYSGEAVAVAEIEEGGLGQPDLEEDVGGGEVAEQEDAGDDNAVGGGVETKAEEDKAGVETPGGEKLEEGEGEDEPGKEDGAAGDRFLDEDDSES